MWKRSPITLTDGPTTSHSSTVWPMRFSMWSSVDGDNRPPVQAGELGRDQARHALAEDRHVLADVHVRVEDAVQGDRPDP